MSSANAGEHDEDCGCPLCDPSGRRLQERKLSEQPKYPSQYWKWLSDTGNALGMPGTFNLADVPKEAEEMKADFDEAMALIDLTVSRTDSWECYSCERLANIDGHAPNCRLDAFLKKHGEKK